MKTEFSAIVERDAFLAGLSKALNFVEAKNTIPILRNVLIAATPGGLRIAATDLNVALDVPLGGETLQRGRITVGAHVLAKLLRNLPAGPVKLNQYERGGRLAIEAGKSRLDLETMPVEDFPSFDLPKPFSVFTLSAATLRTMIEKVRFGISTEETRYYLNGIFFRVVGDKLQSVATDGHRLGEWSEPLPVGCDLPGEGVIVPRNTIAGLLKVMNGGTEDVTIKLWQMPSEVRIGFSTSRFTLVSKLIDGSFPDHRRVIPADGHALTVDVGELQRALGIVSAIFDREGRAIRFDVVENSLKLLASNPDVGAVSEEIAAYWRGPHPMEIGFNYKYLTEMLPQIPGDAVTFWMTDSESPVRITASDDRLLYCLMPMHV